MVSMKLSARIILSICAAYVLIPSHSQVARQSAKHGSVNDHSLDVRIESILGKMTLDEKVGQLVQYSAGQPTGPGTGRSDYKEMVAKGQIGSFLNVVDPKEINEYQRIAMQRSG